MNDNTKNNDISDIVTKFDDQNNPVEKSWFKRNVIPLTFSAVILSVISTSVADFIVNYKIPTLYWKDDNNAIIDHSVSVKDNNAVGMSAFLSTGDTVIPLKCYAFTVNYCQYNLPNLKKNIPVKTWVVDRNGNWSDILKLKYSKELDHYSKTGFKIRNLFCSNKPRVINDIVAGNIVRVKDNDVTNLKGYMKTGNKFFPLKFYASRENLTLTQTNLPRIPGARPNTQYEVQVWAVDNDNNKSNKETFYYLEGVYSTSKFDL